jgi:RNA polymerase sigma factor (sigma-70 family)
LDEKELIQQLLNGGEEGFRFLVDRYRKPVFHTILNILQNEAEAEDAAQETFIQVFESIGSFKGEASLATWLYRIAVHKALDKLRRRKSQQRLRKVLPWWMPTEKTASEDFIHPGIDAENKEKASVLFKAIGRLPEKQKIAFTLIKVQGMSYEEASKITEQNIKAVESLITRARTNLQKQLADYYEKHKY